VPRIGGTGASAAKSGEAGSGGAATPPDTRSEQRAFLDEDPGEIADTGDDGQDQ